MNSDKGNESFQIQRTKSYVNTGTESPRTEKKDRGSPALNDFQAVLPSIFFQVMSLNFFTEGNDSMNLFL